MALSEYQREKNRLEAENRRKDNDKLLRQQTESVRRIERAQLADQQHAANIREQELGAQRAAAHAASRAAAQAASRAADLAEERLNEQREHNAAIADHNFTMWRQGTVNGARYDEWAWQARPLVKELGARDQRFTEAWTADVNAHSRATTSEIMKQCGLDHPRFKSADKERGTSKRFLALKLVGYPVLVLLVPVILWWIIVLVASWFGVAWSWEGLVYLAIIAVSLACCWPITIRNYRRTQEWHLRFPSASQEIQSAKASFVASMPANWHNGTGNRARNLLETAASTIESMPNEYTSFHLSVLTELVPVPPARAISGIDERASNMLTLIRELGGGSAV